MRRIIGLIGPSNSGKTTLIERLTALLIPDKRVVVVKHDPGDKAQLDQQGKDSYRFFQTGADVFVVSPIRMAYFAHYSPGLEQIINMAGNFDYLFIEGLKTWPVPKLVVFRDKIDESYLPYARAIVIDKYLARGTSDLELPVFLNTDYSQIMEWIDNNAMHLD